MPKPVWCRAIPAGFIMLALASAETSAQTPPRTTESNRSGTCDLQALEASETEFLRLVALRRGDAAGVTDERLRQASSAYVAQADQCYTALYGSGTQFIDDDGLWFTADGSQPYVTFGTKWGAGSPFSGGANVPGPHIPGGMVTYSFMANGVSMDAESADPNLAFTGLPTYAPCFLTEITNAFAAWSAVANIQFQQVADNGVAFNGPGATGDIRIGAHTFDGSSAVLAHGFYPPPNGNTAAGDLHFDRAENWSCTAGPGLIDIGIVAVHEIGHAIGLNHETTNPAIMRPYYNPAVTVPLADDNNAASSIYGNPIPARRTANDFDGDGKTDLTVWRPSTGVWWEIKSSDGAGVARQWGAGYSPYNDVPVAGDYDGDGKTDFAVWRRATAVWYIIRSSDGGVTSWQWGAAYAPYLDVPVPGDYDGDGKTDIAVWRSSTGVWYIIRSSDGGVTTRQWGAGLAPYLDVPVPGDYDGDGKTDTAVWRSSTGVWYIIRSSDNSAVGRQWGESTDIPIPRSTIQ
jgi:hypothetical protein